MSPMTFAVLFSSSSADPQSFPARVAPLCQVRSLCVRHSGQFCRMCSGVWSASLAIPWNVKSFSLIPANRLLQLSNLDIMWDEGLTRMQQRIDINQGTEGQWPWCTLWLALCPQKFLSHFPFAKAMPSWNGLENGCPTIPDADNALQKGHFEGFCNWSLYSLNKKNS
jgi:hypothetical protein